MLSSALLFLALILGPVLALLIGVMLIVQRKMDGTIERNRGGPLNYHPGDMVCITYRGEEKWGRIKKIAPVREGQLPMYRLVTIVIKWADGSAKVHRIEVQISYYLIKG